MRSIPQRIFETDNMILLIVGIAIGLLTTFALPLVIPRLESGAICTDLGQPIGGNNRSLLALKGNDLQKLAIEVKILNPEKQLAPNEPLRVQIIFYNRDAGPIILYLPERDLQLGAGGLNRGLNLQIENILEQRLFYAALVGFQFPGAGQPLPERDLYLLPSHEQCAMEYTFENLPQVGMNIGEYRIQAVYTNNSKGALAPPAPGIIPTATPAFPTEGQGAWIGQAESDEVQFNIVIPTPTPFAAPPVNP